MYRPGSGPIRIPNTPQEFRQQQLADLNKRLEEWGFLEDVNDFSAAVMRDFVHHSADQGALKLWVQEKEKWIACADKIFEDIEKFMWGGFFDSMNTETTLLPEMWRNLSGVAFRVQYMIATTEAILEIHVLTTH